jgi:large repetitive protein
MKYLKIFLLLLVTGFVFKNVTAQTQGSTNASLNILSANAGVVNQGGILDLSVSVTNTGANPILANRVRVQISIPSAIALPLVTGSQTSLFTNWVVTSNNQTTGVITICNNTDVIPAGATRTSIIKISANTVGGPLTISAGLAFGTAASCTAFGSLPGDVTGDNTSTTTMVVQTAPACAITASASAGIIACNGGTTTLTAASAGTSNQVEYSIGGAYQLSSTFTVPAGTYTVTAREVATPLCLATATAVVISQPALVTGTTSTTSASSATSTNGTATVVAAGGTGAYSYSWNTTPVQTTATATGLAVGTYTVTITTANSCTGSATATVSATACNIAATASAGSIACNGGTTTLTAVATGASGAVEYSIGGAFQTAATFTVPAGTYTVTAREVANTSCSVNATAVTVTQPTAALVASSTSTAILCNNGNSTVTVSATGGTAPYTGTGTFTRTGGAYTYTVTDANLCTAVTTGTIANPAAITVTATFAPITVFGGTTTVNVSATGGTGTLTGTGAFVRGDGTFTFTVTDANSCTGSTTIVIAPFSTPVTADPAVGQMNFTTIANALQSANNLLFTQDYKLRIPFYNLNQTEVVPNGTISLRINLGSKLSLATGFNLATAPLSNYFTFTSATVADSVIITGTQIAAIPEDFASTLVFNVKGRLSCTANLSTKINVVNTAALLIDEDLNNNAAAIQYTLPVTVTTTQVNVTCNGAANGIINVTASPGATFIIKNAANVTVTNTGLAPGVYTVTATATGDAPLSNTCSNSATVVIVQPVLLAAASSTTANNLCNGGSDGVITATSTGGTAPYTYTITGPTVNTTGATSGIFTGLSAGTYTITSKDANLCTATTTATVTQPVGTAPNLSLGSDITSSFFATSGVTQTIVYAVSEIAGNPAVGDTIRITRVAGFTINLNTAIASTTVGSTTYTLDNARWKIDNTDPAFVSIILTNPLNATAPGTILCNQTVRVAVSLTRNTTDLSTFTLSARLRRANGELILTNNLNSIIMTAE